MVLLSISLLSLPAFAQDCNSVSCTRDLTAVLSVSPTVQDDAVPGMNLADDRYESIGLREEVFEKAKKAFQTAWEREDTRKTTYTIIDYSLDSDEKRLWVIDMDTGEVLFQEYVAHGRNSGLTRVTKLSNVPDSKTSNIGLLRTAETYYGKHGYSLKLDGLESGFNDKARARYIVMHASNYVTDAYIEQHGRAGRSWGCPAIDPAISKELIDRIKGGSLIFGHYPDPDWLGDSRYLN